MASLTRKFEKLRHDPIGYCLDSRHGFLRGLGARNLERQSRLLMDVGAANARRKITVIMTAHNTQDHVGAAIQSVLDQSHSNLELMVIDDASTDGTLGVLKQYIEKDERVRVFHSPVNHGTYWSKNWCLAHAKGDFIAFHDSDDQSHRHRLQHQLGALTKGDGVEAVTCHWRRVDTDGNLLHINGKPSRMSTISLMFRREPVLEKMGYFDSVRIAADAEFLRRFRIVFGKKRLKHLRQILYTGLLRDGSLTRSTDSGLSWTARGRKIDRGELSGDRAAYHNSFELWHEKNQQKPDALKIAYPATKRCYEAPEALTRGCEDQNIGRVQEIFTSSMQPVQVS